MLQLKPYVPLLRTGIAEVDAYRSLYPDIKDRTFPIFLARPWPNASHLQLTVKRIKEAVGDQPFGLSLDADRHGFDNSRAAQREFDALFNESRGFQAYYNFVGDIGGAVPVLQSTRSPDILLHQLGNAERLDRGLIVHQRRGATIPLSDILIDMPPLPHDTLFVVDAGWSRNYIDLESWALPVLERIVNALPEAEIVVMSSSFPDSFSHIIGDAEETGSERRLYSALTQRFQQTDLTYGDWGSTRPTLGGGGGAIPSRIDIPSTHTWHIFRADPDLDPGFPEVAWIAHHHECFNLVPDCWGKETVAITDDQGAGVTGRQVAAAARINMHMTIQSGGSSILPTDEVPYQD
ncbi:beta family protein [Sphingobium sp. JS3065]|uniref:beta family protein n=1 Tax=Sphingobium sp. JS3065 TaxID=2970925 RepID=UPI0022655863|nr:hypothetical protein [Sphingobium sp. JS3065]UZW55409.1 beta family protein [Sphingobium sp. JS3065]